MNKVNINIKSLFIILILSIYFPITINSTEIIITIPDQYNTKEMPLPPFPEEVVSQLTTNTFDSQLGYNQDVRWIEQKSISYNYYTDFLKLSPHGKGFFSNRFIVQSSLDNTQVSCNPEYKSNSLKLSGLGGYDINENVPDLSFQYSEYRAPFNIVTSAHYSDSSLSLLIGNRDYYNYWYLNPIKTGNSVTYSGQLSDKRGIRPHVLVNYTTELEHFGALAFGFNYASGNLRGGTAVINRSLFPYAELYLKRGSFLINLETDVEESKVNYLVEAGYRKQLCIKAGIGAELYSDYYYDPYISFKENLFFGQREYKIYQDKLLLDLTIYIDGFLSIFSFGYERTNKINLSAQAGIYNRFNIKSTMDYSIESEDYLIELLFEYKVGKI